MAAYSKNNLITDLNSMIHEIEKEIENRKAGLEGNGTVEQLNSIKVELEEIRQRAQTDSIPPKNQRHTAFSRMVIDEWDLGSALGDRLCQLADKYRRKEP